MEDELKKYSGTPGLADAVYALIKLAMYLDHIGSKSASKKIVKVIKTTDAIKELTNNKK